MNSDQLIGKTKEIIGEVQEYTGRFLGDRDIENIGYNLEFEGLSQRKRGEAKQAFEELLENKFQA